MVLRESDFSYRIHTIIASLLENKATLHNLKQTRQLYYFSGNRIKKTALDKSNFIHPYCNSSV